MYRYYSIQSTEGDRVVTAGPVTGSGPASLTVKSFLESSIQSIPSKTTETKVPGRGVFVGYENQHFVLTKMRN